MLSQHLPRLQRRIQVRGIACDDIQVQKRLESRYFVVMGEELTVPDRVEEVLVEEGGEPPVLLVQLCSRVHVGLCAVAAQRHEGVLDHALQTAAAQL